MDSSKIVFDEGPHTYTNKETGEGYKSVSSIISKFKNPFPKAIISKAVAKKRGVTQREILDEWKGKADLSTNRGTYFHKRVEDYLNKVAFEDPIKGYDEEKKDWDISFFEDYLPGIKKWELFDQDFKTELLVYNDEYKMAGQIDLAVFKEGNKVSLTDWKTNKEINLISKYNKTMLGPLSHLEECEANIYTIQLSIYAFMLEEAGYEIDKLTVVHFRKDGGITQYQLPYRREEVKKILALL